MYKITGKLDITWHVNGFNLKKSGGAETCVSLTWLELVNWTEQIGRNESFNPVSFYLIRLFPANLFHFSFNHPSTPLDISMCFGNIECVPFIKRFLFYNLE